MDFYRLVISDKSDKRIQYFTKKKAIIEKPDKNKHNFVEQKCFLFVFIDRLMEPLGYPNPQVSA